MDEQLVRDCLRMYRERAAYFENEWRNSYNNGYDDPGYSGMAGAYRSAATMPCEATKKLFHSLIIMGRIIK